MNRASPARYDAILAREATAQIKRGVAILLVIVVIVAGDGAHRSA